MKPIKIAVGSQNPVKIDAVRKAFARVWPGQNFLVTAVAVNSGVPHQPMSDRESLRGAKTRAHRALKALKADFGVGLEGGLQKIGQLWFDCGWVVVIDRKLRTGYGSSLRLQIPVKIVKMTKLIRAGLELGDVVDRLFNRQNSKQAEGHFGLMTKGALNRTQAYTAGVISALARFIHPELF